MGVERLVADGQLELRPVTETIEPSLVEAVRESHAHLAPWMFWASDDYGPRDAQVFIGLVASGGERAYAIAMPGDHGSLTENRAGGRCGVGLGGTVATDWEHRTVPIRRSSPQRA